MFQSNNLQEKWQPVLEHNDLPEIKDSYRRAVTTVILENQEKALREDRNFLNEAAPVNSAVRLQELHRRFVRLLYFSLRK